MNRIKTTLVVAVATVVVSALPTIAAPISISDGALTVTVDDNGALSATRVAGNEYYNLGVPVADWILSRDSSSFGFAQLGGAGILTGSSLSGGGTSVTLAGAYLGFDVTRRYTVSGGNTLQITTTLANADSVSHDIRLADVYDPDQGDNTGFGAATFNDIDAGTATSSEPNGFSVRYSGNVGHLSYLPGLNITNLSELDSFFAGVIDPNGLYEDIGVGVGWDAVVMPGQSVMWTYDQTFTPGVPEPKVLLFLAIGLVGLIARGLQPHRLRSIAAG